MNIWERLGIEATEDERAIKRAYAVLLKKCQPETDPNGFIVLRSAYESALKFAQNGSFFETMESEDTDYWEPESSTEENTGKYEDYSDSEPKEDAEEDSGVPGVAKNTDFSPENSVFCDLQDEKSKFEVAETIFEETKKLLQNDVKKLVESNWLLIFQYTALWNLQVKEIYVELLFYFFSKSNTQVTLPNKIWLLINQFCCWREREIELYKIYPSDKVDSVLHPIRIALKEKTFLRTKKASLMRMFPRDIMALSSSNLYPVATGKPLSVLLMNILFSVWSLVWYLLIKIKDFILYIGSIFLILVLLMVLLSTVMDLSAPS